MPSAAYRNDRKKAPPHNDRSHLLIFFFWCFSFLFLSFYLLIGSAPGCADPLSFWLYPFASLNPVSFLPVCFLAQNPGAENQSAWFRALPLPAEPLLSYPEPLSGSLSKKAQRLGIIHIIIIIHAAQLHKAFDGISSSTNIPKAVMFDTIPSNSSQASPACIRASSCPRSPFRVLGCGSPRNCSW